MESYAAPLRSLAQRTAAFVRDRRVRLFTIATNKPLRQGALDVVLGLEYHADNKSPFVAIHGAFDKRSAWKQFAAELREQHQKRREKMGEAKLPALAPLPPQSEPHADLALTIGQMLDARCAPLEGLVVVLAPAAILDPESFVKDFVEIARLTSARGARFVLVEGEKSCLPPRVIETFAPVMQASAIVDEAAARADLEAQLNASASASLDAPGPAQLGAAWPPGVNPPARRAVPKPSAAEIDALAREIGVPVGYFGTAIREVRPLVLRAALAMRSGDAFGAVRFQGLARERCAAAGMVREALVMDLVRATFILHTGERDVAETSYRDVADRSKNGGFMDLCAQALMAAASMRVLARDPNGAAVTYGQAGRVAKDAGHPGLAIECFRMAGQLTARHGDREMATRLWSESLSIAKDMSDGDAKRTSAPLAARELAAHMRSMGMPENAPALDALADRLERSA
jgi:hypothetical protein